MDGLSYTLGIDMGIASVGWAVVDVKKQFVDSGVRIFPAAVEAFNTAKEKRPNQDRRMARGMRRRIRRKAERRALIRALLTDLGWISKDDEEIEKWLTLDVYELRHRALFEKITLAEFARILLHFNQRRGFLSLRKSLEAASDKETEGLLGSIHALEEQIQDTGSITFGNFLYQEFQKNGIKAKLRGKAFSRKLLHQEFSKIWEIQSVYYPDVLTESLRYGTLGPKGYQVVKPEKLPAGQTLLESYGLENIIFFQRRVWWPKSSIGMCELELGEKRAPVVDRRFQEFRMLQEINNLRILDHSVKGAPEERLLTPEERGICLAYVTSKDKPKLEALKKELCQKSRNLPAPSQVVFNLEAGGRITISGTPTDAKLSSKSSYGPTWYKLPDNVKNRIVEILSQPDATDEDIIASLREVEGIDPAAIPKLASAVLPSGYGHLSIKALEKLLKPMRDGLLYMHKDYAKSAMAAADYPRRDQMQHDDLAELPRLEELANPDSPIFDRNQPIISSPLVTRSLTELRKVVNGLIRKYGKPAAIHVEMARDLKMSGKKRDEHQKRTRKFEKERQDAVAVLEEYKVVPTKDAIQLVQLWEQQGRLCPYSRKIITPTQLLGGHGDVDIDHIFPFSRSGDDSLTNKVVCFAELNRDKKNRTPYEWLADQYPDRYEEVIQNTKHYPHGKAKRFLAKEIPEDFASRDLNDTAWMAKAARHYLSHLFPSGKNRVLGTKGHYTAFLREHWGLHNLLRNDGIELKNRDDHRHHALDAILIALSDQGTIKQLLARQKFRSSFQEAKEEGKRLYHLRHEGDKLDAPWPNFRTAVESSLNAIWVSHRPSRKVSGPLHKETNYGKTHDGLLVVRKPVQSLSAKEVEGIRDGAIRTLVKEFISNHGGDIKVLKTLSHEEPLSMSSGIPIHKVRVAIPYAHLTIRKGGPHETHVQSASTHHLAIFSLGDGKHHFEPVSLYEATRRLRAKEPIIQKHFAGMPPEAEFMFHLCSGDSMMAEIDGVHQLFVFNTMASSTGQTWFAYHTDAAKGHADPQTGRSLLRSCMPGSFGKNFPKAHKVEILPTGEIRNAT